MSRKTFYITTPIYYPSDNLHIGHAYTTVAADTMARYKRMRGYDVFFLTGSDEHGQKIERKAQSEGLAPLTYVDRIVANFQHLWQQLYISNDDFIRTTEERHKRVVQEIFQKIYEQGDIYKSQYAGWYCTPCETFWTERQAEGGVCPDCGRPVELLHEESYFFRLSKYQDRLLRYIEENPDFIQPVTRRNEMINFIKSGLEDLCVSRTTFKWGVPVPFAEGHVIYVWFDALTNYISAIGYGTDPEKFARYWPADVHLVGKDIVRFHTIIWPIILMAAGLPLPKKVFGHGWLLLEGGKMSKSKGNVVDPLVLIDKYGVDAIRYYLLRELPFGADGYYSEDALIQRINSDLANDLGNLVSRTLAMIERYFDGTVPAPGPITALDQEVITLAQQTVREVEELFEKFELSNALITIWRLIGRLNKYIDETAPWALAKDESRRGRLGTVLYQLAEGIRWVTILCSPFMPVLPTRVWPQLGLVNQPEQQTWASLEHWGGLPAGGQIKRGQSLFPRVETEAEAVHANTAGGLVIGPTPTDRKDGSKVNSINASNTAPAAVPETKPEPQLISIDDFARIELRVAQIVSAKKVEKADKLLEIEVEVGGETRTIVSGIAQYYAPADLIGKKIVLVYNLKPSKIRGIQSQGMLLAASNGEQLEVLMLNSDIPTGSRVK